jgi:hypothetical protein
LCRQVAEPKKGFTSDEPLPIPFPRGGSFISKPPIVVGSDGRLRDRIFWGLVKAWTPVRIGILALVVFAGLTLGLFLWQPVWLLHSYELRTGNEIVSRVETFRASHGRLPETLREVGMKDPELKVFYRKFGDGEYGVWFGTTLGESVIFTSRAKK